MNRAETKRNLQEIWNERGIDVDRLRVDERGTLVEANLEADTVATGGDSLPLILDHDTGELRLGATLGQGGMGIVRSARQTALDREVAVKMPRLEADPRFADADIVREARTTGALEHPNVVPVHALGRDPAGRPVLVMKRIEGDPWRLRLVRDLEAGGGTLPRDRLRAHLEVLKQVAAAVHYAHARGVVHRDLKPDNVMIGAFGEVYVVDWGIAVAVGDNAPRHLPRAADVKTVVGTACYMAPEMAEGAGRRLSPRTDVYLLGSILHELLVGQPPHQGDTIIEALMHAYESPPIDYPATVPGELAGVCRRAMAAAPERRFADASRFREALVQFEEHLGSVALAEAAHDILSQMATAGPERLPELFGECRFGFTQALHGWPENAIARSGLNQAMEHMIAHELARDRVQAAEHLLSEMADPPADLVSAVTRARQREDEQRGRLERLEWDTDLSLAGGLRASLILALGAVWLGTFIVYHLLAISEVWHFGCLEMACVMALYGLFNGAGAWLMRDKLLANAANRMLIGAYTALFWVYTIYFLVADVAGVEFAIASALWHVMVTAAWVMSAFVLDWRHVIAAPPGLLAAAATVAWPQSPLLWTAIAGGVSLTLFAMVNRPGGRRPSHTRGFRP